MIFSNNVNNYGIDEDVRYCNIFAPGADPVDVLKSSSDENPWDEIWQGMFELSLDADENGDMFSIGVKELGILDLPYLERRLFWCLAKHFTSEFCEPASLLELRAPNYEDANLKAVASELERKDLLMVTRDGETKVVRYVLSIRAVEKIFRGRDDVVSISNVLSAATYVRSAQIEPKELCYAAASLDDMKHLNVLISESGYNRASDILRKRKRPAGITAILWGPPGTGKTESVRQMAHSSDRNIIFADSSRMIMTGWGESEKMYRSLFRTYRYVKAVSSKTPILLLNEADQFLTNRIAVERSIDKSENTIVAILLEEIERFEGILLATTNNVDSLDPAFDRRFLFKIKLDEPDEEARCKIWKTMLPELDDNEAAILSEYPLTGAQIANVVTKRDLAELYQDTDLGVEFLKGLCITESQGWGSNRKKRIGFR